MNEIVKTNGNGNGREVPSLPTRIPYHPEIGHQFGFGQEEWKALVEAVWPGAKSQASVVLALSYCRARKLDPFKKPVHIVATWDSDQRKEVESVWPGIGETRTTAFRTREYAGRDLTQFGPTVTKKLGADPGGVEMTFPEWAQVTVYRIVQGQRVAYAGPPVYWEETYAQKKNGAPNSMWRRRPRGQIDKCAEAAALRAAFPEEVGDWATADEVGTFTATAGPLVEHEPETADRPQIDMTAPFSDATPPVGASEPGDAEPAPPAASPTNSDDLTVPASLRREPKPRTATVVDPETGEAFEQIVDGGGA